MPFWSHRGVIFRHLGAIFAHLGAILGASCAVFSSKTVVFEIRFTTRVGAQIENIAEAIGNSHYFLLFSDNDDIFRAQPLGS